MIHNLSRDTLSRKYIVAIILEKVKSMSVAILKNEQSLPTKALSVSLYLAETAAVESRTTNWAETCFLPCRRRRQRLGFWNAIFCEVGERRRVFLSQAARRLMETVNTEATVVLYRLSYLLENEVWQREMAAGQGKQTESQYIN